MLALHLLAALALPQDQAPLPESVLPEVVAEAGPREGQVTLSCLAQPDGRITDCRVVSETPRGVGFGRAALDAARRARLTPQSVREGGRGARVTFTIRFTLSEPDEDEAPDGTNP